MRMRVKRKNLSYKSVRVLVTGGAGFIGAHLVESLVRHGAHVTVVTRKRTDAWRLLHMRGRIKLVPVDLSNEIAVRRLITREKPRIIFHLAGRIDNRQDVGILTEMFDANVVPALHLLDAVRDSDIHRLIMIGSGSEYGDQEVPFSEIHRELPHSPYGLSKAVVTRCAELYRKLADLDVVITRPSSVFGPGQDLGMLIPNAIHACLGGRDFHMSVHAREQARDFLYVDDLVDGLMKLGGTSEILPPVINLGAGRKTRVSDVVDRINALTGNQIMILFDKQPYYRFDNPAYYMNIGLAKKCINWRARTPFDTALEKTIKWYVAHEKRMALKKKR